MKNKNNFFKNFLKNIYYYLFIFFSCIFLLLFNIFFTQRVYNQDKAYTFLKDLENPIFSQNPNYSLDYDQIMREWTFFSFAAKGEKTAKTFKIVLDNLKYMIYLNIIFAFDKKNTALENELHNRKFEIQDEIIHFIASKSIDEVNSTKKRELYLKKEILNISNLKVFKGKIEAVFITDFFISKLY